MASFKLITEWLHNSKSMYKSPKKGDKAHNKYVTLIKNYRGDWEYNLFFFILEKKNNKKQTTTQKKTIVLEKI